MPGTSPGSSPRMTTEWFRSTGARCRNSLRDPIPAKSRWRYSGCVAISSKIDTLWTGDDCHCTIVRNS
ncbi:MAG TPA: hypothetical protein VKT99_10720 [Xanthobacteraceae bacterium]|nr:hypothetical protein [Xanthobacteraceae bacterium]